MATVKNMVGARFGRLIVIERLPNKKGGKAQWLCKCDCGNNIVVITAELNNGHVQSCGCLRREGRKPIHGLARSKIDSIYHSMLGRCYNSKDRYYKDYGGRGISVCEEWRNRPKVFFDWAFANGYKEGLSIERKDVNGNYEPSNCCWIELKKQAENKTNTIYIIVDGCRVRLLDFAKSQGVCYSTAYDRYRRGVYER